MSIASYFNFGSAGRPRSSARRASILLIIMGTLAAALGIFALIISVGPDTIFSTPDVQRLMQELHLDAQNLRLMFKILSGMFLAYALGAVVLGIMVRGGRLAWLITGVVFSVGVLCFILLGVIISFAGGNGSNLFMPICLGTGHVLVVAWLINAIRTGQSTTSYSAQASQDLPTPLAGYYAVPPFDV